MRWLEKECDVAGAQPAADGLDAVDRVLLGVVRQLHTFQRGNADPWRHPSGLHSRALRTLIDLVWQAANRAGLTRKGYDLDGVLGRIAVLLERRDDFCWLHRRLADERSRALANELQKFRIIGARHVKLPSNGPSYWTLRRRAVSWREQRKTGYVAGYTLDRFAIDGEHGVVRMDVQAAHVLNTFLLEQYVYRHRQPPIAVLDGDIVLDVGGGWGDTALYFAQRVGPRGHVYSFEGLPGNAAILRRNVELNPALAERITIVPTAVWSRSGESLPFASAGPGSRAVEAPAADVLVPSITIDDFVRERRVPRVDFIKMDIEGAEGAALRGARETIGRFRPRLAIAAYHRPEDLMDIPRAVEGLDDAYEMYLDHFTIFDEETVLFACSSRIDRPRRLESAAQRTP